MKRLGCLIFLLGVWFWFLWVFLWKINMISLETGNAILRSTWAIIPILGVIGILVFIAGVFSQSQF